MKTKIHKMKVGSLRGQKIWTTILDHTMRMLERASLSTTVSIERADDYSFTVLFPSKDITVDGHDVIARSFCDPCDIRMVGDTRVCVDMNLDNSGFFWRLDHLPGKYDSFWLKYQNQEEVSPMFFDPKAIGKKMPGLNTRTPCSGRGKKSCTIDARYDEHGYRTKNKSVVEDEDWIVDETPRICTRFRNQAAGHWLHCYIRKWSWDLRMNIWTDYISPQSRGWSLEWLEKRGFDVSRFDTLWSWSDNEIRDFTIRYGGYYERLSLRKKKDRRLNIRREAYREKKAFLDSFLYAEEEVETTV